MPGASVARTRFETNESEPGHSHPPDNSMQSAPACGRRPSVSGVELLVLLGAGLLVAGTVAPALRGALAAALGLQAVGIALLGIGGALVLFGAPELGVAFRSALCPALGVDGLSGLFLATLALVGAPALVYSRGYLAGVASRPSAGRPRRAVPDRPRGRRHGAGPVHVPRLLGADDPGARHGDPRASQRRRGPPCRLRLPGGHPPGRRRRLDLRAGAGSLRCARRLGGARRTGRRAFRPSSSSPRSSGSAPRPA